MPNQSQNVNLLTPEAILRTSKLLWSAFSAMQVGLAIVVNFVAPRGELTLDGYLGNPVALALAGVGIATFFAAFQVPGLMARATEAQSQAKPGGAEQLRLQAVFTRFIVRLVMMEFPGLMGFVTAVVMQNSLYAYPLIALAFVGIFLAKPADDMFAAR